MTYRYKWGRFPYEKDEQGRIIWHFYIEDLHKKEPIRRYNNILKDGTYVSFNETRKVIIAECKRLNDEHWEATRPTCTDCAYFVPYQDGCPDGRCLQVCGRYGSHTIGSDKNCGAFRRKKNNG